MKKWILLAALGSGLQAPAQTLFTYGTDSVSVQEFLQAWKKNNGGKASAADRRAYLDLYIASKLKVKEARALGFDTLAQLNADLDNLRGQLLPAYLTDTTLVEGLVREAAARAAKDIHLQHIFISFTGRNGQADTAGAEQRVTAAVRALKGGASFETVARQYSDDPAAAANGGDIGFITVFTLPYFLENLAYGTPEGAVSDQLRSRSGYHIFRNAGTRPALGRVKAAQILLALPPGAGEKEEAALRRRADSLYARLLKGDDFARLAAAFSNDYVSAAANGQLPEFGVGQYDPLFESTVFSLGNGKISRPFRTAHGYHIVKKIAAVPPPVNGKDASVRAALKSRVEGSDRMEQVGVAFAARVQQQVTVRPEPFSAPALWTLTDSLLAGQPAPALPVGPATPLVQVGRQAYTAADWVEYARTARFRPDGSGLRPYEEVWKDFLQRSAMDYYRAHLEDYNEAFRAQLAEFRDGNLFFEIMQRKIWEPAQSDTAALRRYFEQHREAYRWKDGAEAVVFYASDAQTARDLSAALKKNPKAWQQLAAGFSEKVAVDHGRFEWEQLPAGKVQPQAGTVTSYFVNPDGTATFMYVLRRRPGGDLRSFEEARAQLIIDYQAELEQQWLAGLKQKYPVRVDERVYAGIRE